jgi:hypothetical protein
MKPSPQRLMRSLLKIFSIGFATVVTVFHPTENRYKSRDRHSPDKKAIASVQSQRSAIALNLPSSPAIAWMSERAL